MVDAQILFIEDNHDNQQLITWILEDEGYSIDCADTAEIGLTKLSKQRFDLVLMDISLPGMDGKQATQIIRSTPEIAAIPVIALTAHAVLQERDNIISSGVNDMLTKPVDEEKLIATVKKFLHH